MIRAHFAGHACRLQHNARHPNLADNANYALMRQYLDVPEFIDYMLLHFFIGHQDWGDAKNWYAVRRRISGPGGTFKYLPWDGECVLMNEDVNRVPNGGGSTDVPSGLHTKLDDNAEYRLEFADHVFKHMLAPAALSLRQPTSPAGNAHRRSWTSLSSPNPPAGATTAAMCISTRTALTCSTPARISGWLKTTASSVPIFPTATPLFSANSALPACIQAWTRRPSTKRVAGSLPDSSFRCPPPKAPFTSRQTVLIRVFMGRVPHRPRLLSILGQFRSIVRWKSKARGLSSGKWSALNEASFTVGELGVPLRITEIMYNPLGGDAYEFVEVMNVGPLPVDASGFSFQGIDFIFPDNSTLQPGTTLVLASSANPAAFEARYPTVSVFGYFGGHLDNGGERLAILDQSGRTVTAVHYDDSNGWPVAADGTAFSLEAIDPGGDPDAPANWRVSSIAYGTPGLPPSAPSTSLVVLNEIMADNESSVTNDGGIPDWIELCNSGSNSVDLSGWSLTDDSDPRKFVFPLSTTIEAGSFLVLWCDTATNAPGLHTSFKLDKTGDSAFLYDAATNRVDAISFGLQLADFTIGRVGEDWQLTHPTPGLNNIPTPLASPAGLSINEWMANPPPAGEDWIELFNSSSNGPIALRGFYLGAASAICQLRALSFIAPRGYAQLLADENPGPNHLEFKLPASGGDITLYDPTGLKLGQVSYGPQLSGVSQGRLPDGSDTITNFDGSASPGAANYLLAWSGPLLNEVLARNKRALLDPWGNYADFVELFNPNPTAADLGSLALGQSHNDPHPWIFPAGTTIQGESYLLVWCDNTQPPSTQPGPVLNSGFALDGSSGSICLFDTTGQPVDCVDYAFQIQDLPIGRVDGAWRLLSAPTPGASNSAPAILGSPASLRINEWMAAPLSGNDWFELYNTSILPVDLSGLFLTDNPSTTGITNTPIAPLSFIAGQGWVTWIADGRLSGGRDHANFSLDSLGETLRLYEANLVLLDAIDFGIQSMGVSQGRLPDGSDSIVGFPAGPTPGASNDLSVSGPPPSLGKPSRLPGGEFSFVLSSQTNRTYTIEFSTNLLQWVSVKTVEPTNSQTVITLTSPIENTAAFYRAQTAQ